MQAAWQRGSQRAALHPPPPHKQQQPQPLTLGCDSDDEIAVSMIAIFSRFSAPLIPEGSTIVLTATAVPFQSAL